MTSCSVTLSFPLTLPGFPNPKKDGNISKELGQVTGGNVLSFIFSAL